MDDVSSETCLVFIKKMNLKSIVWLIKAIIIIIIIIIIKKDTGKLRDCFMTRVTFAMI